MKYKVKSRMR